MVPYKWGVFPSGLDVGRERGPVATKYGKPFLNLCLPWKAAKNMMLYITQKKR